MTQSQKIDNQKVSDKKIRQVAKADSAHESTNGGLSNYQKAKNQQDEAKSNNPIKVNVIYDNKGIGWQPVVADIVSFMGVGG